MSLLCYNLLCLIYIAPSESYSTTRGSFLKIKQQQISASMSNSEGGEKEVENKHRKKVMKIDRCVWTPGGKMKHQQLINKLQFLFQVLLKKEKKHADSLKINN